MIGDLATPSPTQFNLDTIEDSLVYSVDEAGGPFVMNTRDELAALILMAGFMKAFTPKIFSPGF